MLLYIFFGVSDCLFHFPQHHAFKMKKKSLTQPRAAGRAGSTHPALDALGVEAVEAASGCDGP
jgi:hypothetical protein